MGGKRPKLTASAMYICLIKHVCQSRYDASMPKYRASYVEILGLRVSTNNSLDFLDRDSNHEPEGYEDV